MNRIAGRAGITILLAVLLLAGFSFFLCEYFWEAEDWVVHTGSPHVYNGDNIGCGLVTDRDGVFLLDMGKERTYAENKNLRKSVIHWVGDRYGSINAPALPNYASELAGFQVLNGVYSYGQTGGVAKLTLSAKVQTEALKAMGDYKGTIGVYNYKTGEILCSISAPTYDPNNVPDFDMDVEGKYEGAYLNRFTQSVYIPGSIFKIVTLAAALESMPEIQQEKFTCTGSYSYGKDKITCESVHGRQTLKNAFSNSCNCAFAQIADKLGGETLQRYANKFGITESVAFDGITTSKGNFDLTDAAPVSVAWSSIGQYTDEINVCRFMTFVGAIANGGKAVIPYLVEDIQVDGNTTYKAQKVEEDTIISLETVKIIQEYLRYNVTRKYGDDNFPGLTVCAKTGTAEVGGGKKPNAMLTGFVLDEEYPLAFIVAVEDGGYGRTVCMPIISKVLQACKAAMDS